MTKLLVVFAIALALAYKSEQNTRAVPANCPRTRKEATVDGYTEFFC